MTELGNRLNEIVRSPWAAAIIFIFGSAIVGRLVVRIVRAGLHRAARTTEFTWDDALIDLLGTPISMLCAVIACWIAVPWLPFEPRGEAIATTTLVIALMVTVTWILFRIIDVIRLILEDRPWAKERPASRSLFAIGARFAKVAVLIVGTIALLAQLGISVASMIAGLGIGGLAIALASQKTVENVFGTLSIGVDQPMREGDFVKLYDFVGTVEAIGLRSTRIRTLDRTLITIPNGELSSQRIESFTARDRIRLACVLNLVYGTRASQMRTVLAGLERVLRDHPKIWPDSITVRFRELAASSLDIEVMAWFQTTDWNEFQLIRQDILLSFIEVVEAAGSSFAFPTRTVHVETAA